MAKNTPSLAVNVPPKSLQPLFFRNKTNGISNAGSKYGLQKLSMLYITKKVSKCEVKKLKQFLNVDYKKSP